jgi:hypothetical protein
MDDTWVWSLAWTGICVFTIIPAVLPIIVLSKRYHGLFSWDYSSVVFRHKKTCYTVSCGILVKSPNVCPNLKWLRWSRGSMLAFRTQVRGFKPGRSCWIFQGEKILSTTSFGREVKLWVPCRRFTACKRSLNATWRSGIFRLNLPAISLPHISTFGC